MLLAPGRLSRFATSSSGFVSEFLSLSERVSRLAARNGVRVEPYRDHTLPVFSRLPAQRRFEIATALRTYIDAAEAVASARAGRVETAPFLKTIIRKLGYCEAPDLYDKISEDSLVEIYSSDNRLIFKNFRFFEFCSHTLEDLLALDWWRLYWRDDNINRQIFFWGRRVLNGEIRETCVPPIPQHTVIEKGSQRLLSLRVNHDYYSPLFQNGKIVAGVSISRAKAMATVEDAQSPLVTEAGFAVS